jgi:hypothetical protein
MKRFATLAMALLLLSVAAPAFALLPSAGVRGIYWFPKLEGSIQVPKDTGTPLDLRDTLDVGNKNIPGGEAYLKLGNVTFRAGYAAVKFTGNAVVTTPITFQGLDNVTGPVATTLDYKSADGEIQWDFLNPDVGVAEIGLGLIAKVKYIDAKTTLITGSVSESKELKAPIPMVGAAVKAGILKNFVSAQLRGTGIAYSGSHAYEADGFLAVVPFPFLKLQGGYKYLDVKIDRSEGRGELKLKGPYVGLELAI